MGTLPVSREVVPEASSGRRYILQRVFIVVAVVASEEEEWERAAAARGRVWRRRGSGRRSSVEGDSPRRPAAR